MDFKRLICLMLVLVLFLTAGGCGKKNGDVNSGSSETVSEDNLCITGDNNHDWNEEKSVCLACGAEGENFKIWYDEAAYEITEKEVDAIMSQQFTKPKNVIIMIGDGMGANDIAIAEKYASGTYKFGLILNKFKATGDCTTHSANNDVTDSAASATALATGFKTNNGMLGMLPDGTNLTNISELARQYGKKVGIVTTDEIVGATPSAFVVHNQSRSNSNEIAKSFVEFAPDVLVGTKTGQFNRLNLENFVVSNSLKDVNVALNKDNACEKTYLAFFDEDTVNKLDNSLVGFTDAALKRLKNDSGFFLMIENAGTDWAGHHSSIQQKMNSVVNFDRSIAVVLKFMKENPDTLLIITSDHETGGVKMPKKKDEVNNKLFTSSGNHTGANVRTFALGVGADNFEGKTVDNTDIAKIAISAIKGE